MAFLAAAIPYIAAGAAAYQAVSSARAAHRNAQIMGEEQANAINQANAQENMVRRNSREMLGRQAAAFGAAGVGYGGSSETALDQSAMNQELDALNTRYRGAITGWGYGTQSQQDTGESHGYNLLAGAALLRGVAQAYTGAPPPQQQAGVVSPQPQSGLGGP